MQVTLTLERRINRYGVENEESHIEGVASHDGPESGTCTREEYVKQDRGTSSRSIEPRKG